MNGPAGENTIMKLILSPNGYNDLSALIDVLLLSILTGRRVLRQTKSIAADELPPIMERHDHNKCGANVYFLFNLHFNCLRLAK